MSDNNTKPLSGLKQTWANPKARKGILLTTGIVGLVIAVTGMSMRNSGNAAPGVQSNAALAPPPAVKPDVTAKVTPQYQEMAVKRDEERAAKAAKSELDMALPQAASIGETKKIDLPNLPPQGGQAAQTRPANQQMNQLNSQSEMQARAQAEQMIRANPAYNVAGAFMTSAAQSINSARTTSFGIIAAPSSGNKTGAATTTAAAGQTGAQATGASVAATPASVMIGAGEALYATVDTAINSDYSGPVLATVRQGKYAGARLIGTKSLEYDAVVLKFNVVSLPTGGPAIPVQAYAINLGDVSKFGTTGLQGSVDYHVMQRYVLPALLAFGQTYGYAASISGSSTTTNGTSTSQSTNPLSDRDRGLVALGGALGPIAADLQKQAQRPITIKMNANTEIGVLFTTDVTDKTQQAAVDQASKGVNAGFQAGASNASPVSNTQTQGTMGTVAPSNVQGGFGAVQSSYTAPYQPASPVYQQR